MLTVEFEKLGLKKGSVLLDIGCGGGRHLRQSRRYPGVIAVGLDLGRKEVRDTVETIETMDQTPLDLGGAVPDAGPWMSIRGSAYHLPFKPNTFDCIIISEVLEHLRDDERALRELSRVLKPGGTLAASVPREGPESVCWALSRTYRESAGGHVRIYRRRALRKKLTTHGYRIFASHFAHGLHAPYWWLKCSVGVDREDSRLVNLYHRLLVWDLMKKPFITQFFDKALNPFIGKSVVFYGIKE
jgi:SAM-dependent methyltransferase